MTTTTTMPDPGLTFVSNGRFMLSEASILVGVDNHRFVDVVPIDCFPGDCLTHEVITAGHKIDFDESERRKIHTAMTYTENVTVTLPEPRFVCHGWLEDLASDTLKAGHVWLDSAETLSDRLTSGLVSRRQPKPPYGTSPAYPDALAARRPTERPEPGLTQVVQPLQVRTEGAADRLRVTTVTGHELYVQLIDCYVSPEYSEIALEIIRDSSLVAITIPPPVDSLDWIGTLTPGSEHAAYIWIERDKTLNQALVDLKLATFHPPSPRCGENRELRGRG
jgi:hypothetical protein